METTFVDLSDIEALKASIKPNTKMIFIETPTNPMMKVADIQEISKIAKEKGIVVAVDNTLLTPYYQKPLTLGADIVLHSGTKYLEGHNDTIAGIVVVKEEGLAEKMRNFLKYQGPCLAPLNAWLTLRGRMEQVKVSDKYKIIIDYAHNELSMESLMDTINEYNHERIICIFGGGGNRSKLRRYAMGEIAGKK